VPWFTVALFHWKGIGFAPLFFVAVGGVAFIYGAIKK
jgi:hypothetical protein